MSYIVAIIGTGQLGSRHLQGLKTVQFPIKIEVIDNDENALSVAKARYNEIESNPYIESIRYSKEIETLSSQLDLVIIATSSKPRFSIIQKLLIHSEVKFLLLEKVLFPSIHEYKEVAELLRKKQVKTWVNCPRRIFEHYKILAEMISSPITFDVVGKNWGLGCNAVHFLDLFAMLSREKEFVLDTTLLDHEIYPSKRTGYVEFTGTITGTTPNGSLFSISSLKEYEQSTTISIKNKNLDVCIDEGNNYMLINGTKKIIQSPFQSQLTGKVVEQILLQGKSDLTIFQESAQIHQQFLSPLINFYNKFTGNNNDICPIT